MSLRARLTLLAATAVAIAIVLAAGIAYVTVQNRLFDEADRTLREQATRVADFSAGPGEPPFGAQPNPGAFPRSDQYLQVIGADGTLSAPGDQAVDLPADAEDRAIARDGDRAVIRNVSADGKHLRMITMSMRGGGAVQIAKPLDEIDNTLASLRITLILVALGGIALAGALGFVVARAVLRPVERLTAAAEHVAETQDLDASININRRDELGRLAASFNTMLGALAASREQQRQLVADASHELRTPLTSVRTNIEVIARQPDMPADERARLLGDVTTQMEELSVLVGDLVELARDDAAVREEETTTLRLDELVERAVDRANLHAHDVETRLLGEEPILVHGRRAQIERALANVLDNACKWSPAGQVVEVRQLGGSVTIRDHGPGIAAADLPHVFDRFYRSSAARSMPGSGLGLSIVRGIMDEHGGTATASLATGGGTVVTLQLPTTSVERPDEADASGRTGVVVAGPGEPPRPRGPGQADATTTSTQ
jgi:two-component system sensor histidine kinase MprB